MLSFASRRSILFLALLVALGAAIPAAADEPAQRKEELRRAEEPLRARQWGDAVEALDAFRKAHPDSEEAVEAWVLEARALLEAGAAQKALDETSGFLAAHGEVAWAGRMRSTAADAYARLKRPKESAETLRERVEATTSEEARAKIGALHLELADHDYDGVETTDDLGQKVVKKDLARALVSYRHAIEVGLPADQALRARERIALCLEGTGHADQAVAVWDGLLDEAEKGTIQASPETRERWLVGRGRARLGAGDLDGARKDLREALDAGSGKLDPKSGLHMEILLLLGQERLKSAAAHGDDVAFEEGVTWLRRAILEHKDDPRAAGAQKDLAQSYESRGQSEKSAAEWAAFVERFPNDPFVPEARDRQAQALLQAGRFDEAIAAWERFLSAHPNHPLWPAVREKIVTAAFQKGQGLQASGDVDGATAAYSGFAEKYPTDARAPVALLLAGDLLRGKKDVDAALQAWRQVVGRYGQTPQAADARLRIALALEDDLARLDEAVKAYEEVVAKHPNSQQAVQAQARLARLKAKSLELRMERVVGTKEKPVLRVTTRNIASLDVRVYRLDMEEYFRRKGTVLGVEGLQLEVVKPDVTAAWGVEGYHPFSLYQADREVPVKEAGAYVVVAGDADLTATVLFVVSDIEIVAKRAAGSDLLVWAFDRQDQAPVTKARVLVAQDGKVIEAGTTGEDGVYHGSRGDRASHVLVLSDHGLAATGLDDGPAVAAGFQSKAYVYTDRPIYRPGQHVDWRAVFLEAGGGAYAPPRARKGQVSVRDARGQTLFEDEVTSSAFGAFAGGFDLDEASPLGTWHVQIQVPNQGAWDGAFEVQSFRKPELTVSLHPKRAVVLTGEKVEAVAEVRYAFGGPVADAPLRYEAFRQPQDFQPSAAEDYGWYFQDDRHPEETRRGAGGGTLIARGEVRTDADGNALLSFDTAERDEDAMVVIRVAVQDVTRRWIADEGRIPVTRRDHMAVVKLDRSVVRPRQELRAEVRTMDALERPVPRSGTLLLLEVRRRPLPPRGIDRGARAVPVAEEEVEHAAYPVTTGRDGSGEVRLQVPSAGHWRLRWKATDGRGALVTAAADVEVAGEAEDLSKDARLVASRRVVTEGDEAEVLLQSPVTGVTALLTYEAEKVLSYQFVRIEGRSTLLSLPVGAELAPNVYFEVAIPASGRLLQADTEVVVLRYLDVDVSLPEKGQPGEKVSVTLHTKDARGRPVAAEVGVALIDETLYALAPDRAGAIRPYFYDRRRQNAVRTASSLGFEAAGTTRETNKDLLADTAVREGGGGPALAEAALTGAREALARGDGETAVLLALRAVDADPSSIEARRFAAGLDAHEEIRELAKRSKEVADQLARLESQQQALLVVAEHALTASPPGERAPMDPSAPKPEAARKGERARLSVREAGEMDARDAESDDDAAGEESLVAEGRSRGRPTTG